MSCIYFHSLDGEAKVRGSERAYAGNLCANITLAVLSPTFDSSRFLGEIAPLVKFIPNGHYLKRTWSPEAFRTWFRVGWEDGLIINGEMKANFTITLNTALTVGSDPIKLLARLHGQCELNAYVEGKDRRWLANIVKEGLASKVLRSEMGWEKVIELLLFSSATPVVTSYSVTDQFPNARYADWEKIYESDGIHYHIEDSWYELDYDKQWGQALIGLRQKNMKSKLQLSPEDWNTFYFGDGVDAFYVAEEVWRQWEEAK